MMPFRFYKLKINGLIFAELNDANPNALRIVFDFKEYSGVETPNKVISLFNVQPELFLKVDKFIGKQVELYGGIKKVTDIGKGESSLVAFGYIQNIIVNFTSGVSNQIDIILSVSPQKGAERYLMEIKKGDGVKAKIKAALQRLYSQAEVKIDGSERTAPDNEKIIATNSYELSNFAAKHKISISQTRNGFLISDDKALGAVLTKIKIEDFIEQPTWIA